MSLLDLDAAMPCVGPHGRRWESQPRGMWEVVRTDLGVDVWTHPTEPLPGPVAREMAAALAAAGQPDEEDET